MTTEDDMIAKAQAAAKAKAPKGRPSAEEIAKRRAAAAERIKAVEKGVEDEDEVLDMEAEEVLAEIVAEQGKLRAVMVRTIGGPVVLRRGPEAAFKSFMAACDNAGKNKTVADSVFRKFVYPAVAYPASAEEFFTEMPAALYFCADQLMKLYGMKAAEDGPK